MKNKNIYLVVLNTRKQKKNFFPCEIEFFLYFTYFSAYYLTYVPTFHEKSVCLTKYDIFITTSHVDSKLEFRCSYKIRKTHLYFIYGP